KSAVAALRECISLGADEAVLVGDRAFAGADTLATSYVLSEAIRKGADQWAPVDLLRCGKQTQDGDPRQVGPGIARRAKLAERALPALVTVVEGINQFRRASMPGMLRAGRYEPITWTVDDFPEIDRTRIGLKGSPTVVGKAWVPEPVSRAGETLTGQDGEEGPGTPAEVARQLFDRLLATELPAQIGWAVAPVPAGDGGAGTPDGSPVNGGVA